MKAFFPPVLLLVLLLVQESTAQDLPLYRSEKPFALKIGLFSLGADLSIEEIFAIDANIYMFLAYDYKARIFLLQRNSTPYIGLGGGRRLLQEGTEELFLFQIGWQHDIKAAIVQLGMLITRIGIGASGKNVIFPVLAIGIRL